MAQASRGFGAGPGRTFLLRTAMGRADAMIILLMVLLLAGSIALRIMGYGG
jgi:hypothetical protein